MSEGFNAEATLRKRWRTGSVEGPDMDGWTLIMQILSVTLRLGYYMLEV